MPRLSDSPCVSLAGIVTPDHTQGQSQVGANQDLLSGLGLETSSPEAQDCWEECGYRNKIGKDWGWGGGWILGRQTIGSAAEGSATKWNHSTSTFLCHCPYQLHFVIT